MKTPLLLLALFFSGVRGEAQTAISVNSARGYPGQSASASIAVRKATNLVAAQFDIVYDNRKGVMKDLTLFPRYTNHIIRTFEIAPGTRRVIVFSRSNRQLETNGFRASFDFEVPAAERVGSGPIAPRNVVLANADAKAILPISQTSGVVFVTPVYRDPETGIADFFFPSLPDTVYNIQASSDLNVWELIEAREAIGDFLDGRDPAAAQNPYRFYRSVPFQSAKP